MAVMPHVVGPALVVRRAALMLATTMLVAFVSVHAFAARYGSAPVSVLVGTRSADDAVSTAVAAQESLGLRCSERPALTDVVLFQHIGSGVVVVLTFDRAVAETAARSGWIRGYCV